MVCGTLRAMRRLVVLAAVLALPSAALANGRFPETKSVAFRPGHPAEITLGSTVGLLLSHDDGKHFFWICDQAIFGDNNNSFDPDYKVAADGTLYANTQGGLRISRDGGCTYELAAVEPSLTHQKWVDAEDLGPSGELWIAQAENGMTNEVFKSTDGGHEFTPVGLMSKIIWWKSVKIARSDPQRVYVTGYQVTQVADDGGAISPTVHVKRTSDGGTKWEAMPIGDFTLASNPMVIVNAVSPKDPNLLFASSIGANPPGDKLYRSGDGGMTWTSVLDTKRPVKVVTFLADDSVLVGTIETSYRSSDGGKTFDALTGAPQIQCAAQREDGQLFACGANWDPDFSALGVATSAAGPWTKVFRFVDMTAPLSCPAGTVQKDVCDLQLWQAVKEQYGIKDPDGPPAPDAPVVTKKPSGCCDSSGSDAESAIVLALAVGVGAALIARGKRRKKDCCK